MNIIIINIIVINNNIINSVIITTTTLVSFLITIRIFSISINATVIIIVVMVRRCLSSVIFVDVSMLLWKEFIIAEDIATLPCSASQRLRVFCSVSLLLLVLNQIKSEGFWPVTK